MRDLQLEEIDQVNGGIGLTIAPIGFGIALGSKFTAVGLTGWALGSAGLITATMGLAVAIGGPGGGIGGGGSSNPGLEDPSDS